MSEMWGIIFKIGAEVGARGLARRTYRLCRREIHGWIGDICIYRSRCPLGRLDRRARVGGGRTGMANVVALPWSGPLRWGHLRRCSRVVVALPVYERSATPLRFAPIGAVVYCAVFPVMQVALIAESGAAGAHRDALWALLATAGFLPLHARHVLAAARGTRPRYGTWTLAAM